MASLQESPIKRKTARAVISDSSVSLTTGGYTEPNATSTATLAPVQSTVVSTRPLSSLTFLETTTLMSNMGYDAAFIDKIRQNNISGMGLVKIAQGKRTFLDYEVDAKTFLKNSAAVADLVDILEEYSKSGVPVELLVANLSLSSSAKTVPPLPSTDKVIT